MYEEILKKGKGEKTMVQPVDNVASNAKSKISFSGSIGANAGITGSFNNKFFPVGLSGVEGRGRIDIPTQKGKIFGEASLNAGTSFGGHIKAGYIFNFGDKHKLELSANGSAYHSSTPRNVETIVNYQDSFTAGTEEINIKSQTITKQTSLSFINTVSGNAKYSYTFNNGIVIGAGLEGGLKKGLDKDASYRYTLNETSTIDTKEEVIEINTQVPVYYHGTREALYITPTLNAELPITKNKKLSVNLDASLFEVKGGIKYNF